MKFHDLNQVYIRAERVTRIQEGGTPESPRTIVYLGQTAVPLEINAAPVVGMLGERLFYQVDAKTWVRCEAVTGVQWVNEPTEAAGPVRVLLDAGPPVIVKESTPKRVAAAIARAASMPGEPGEPGLVVRRNTEVS